MIRIQWEDVGGKHIGTLCGEEIAAITCNSPTDWDIYMFFNRRQPHGYGCVTTVKKAKTIVKKELTAWLNKIFAASVDTRRIEF